MQEKAPMIKYQKMKMTLIMYPMIYHLKMKQLKVRQEKQILRNILLKNTRIATKKPFQTYKKIQALQKTYMKTIQVSLKAKNIVIDVQALANPNQKSTNAITRMEPE